MGLLVGQRRAPVPMKALGHRTPPYLEVRTRLHRLRRMMPEEAKPRPRASRPGLAELVDLPRLTGLGRLPWMHPHSIPLPTPMAIPPIRSRPFATSVKPKRFA